MNAIWAEIISARPTFFLNLDMLIPKDDGGLEVNVIVGIVAFSFRKELMRKWRERSLDLGLEIGLKTAEEILKET